MYSLEKDNEKVYTICGMHAGWKIHRILSHEGVQKETIKVHPGDRESQLKSKRNMSVPNNPGFCNDKLPLQQEKVVLLNDIKSI